MEGGGGVGNKAGNWNHVLVFLIRSVIDCFTPVEIVSLAPLLLLPLHKWESASKLPTYLKYTTYLKKESKIV